MMSLNARLLIAASVVLAAFLSLTGLALDRAYTESSVVAVKERLLTEIFSLLAAADTDDVSSLIMPLAHPDRRFSIPASGLYAEIIADDGQVIWRSPSMIGTRINFEPIHLKGSTQFAEKVTKEGVEVYTLGLGIMWEVAPYLEKGYTFYVAEVQAHFDDQRKGFRKSLTMWLGASVFALLFVQALILRWGLAPLRKVASEISEIEHGERTELSSGYPREIERLATNLNGLIRTSRSQLTRYRNALGDLAHSLKTPLTVLRNLVEAKELPAEVQDTVADQVSRLDTNVEYHLQRAVASGRTVLAAPIAVSVVSEKLIKTFQKVYVDKQVNFESHIDSAIKFVGDEGDLMEILGNLTDNACKWCQRQVVISAEVNRDQDILITVEDDGPGIALEEREQILKRGVRGDSQVEGHGIGLAVVRNLVEEVYQGKLEIKESALGGAKISVLLRR